MTDTPPPWYGPDGIPNTDDDWDQAHIEQHLRDNADLPFDLVRMSDGTVRPAGGRIDRPDGADSE